MDNTKISWADATFNVVWGCTKVSPGCKHCYAESLSRRFGDDIWGPGRPRKIMRALYWNQPLLWNRKAEAERVKKRVFACSMCDVFEEHPTVMEEREKLWSLVLDTPWLDWLLLTKRPENMLRLLPDYWREYSQGHPGVWLGVSVENAAHAWRIDLLRQIPAVVRFVSYEPALGPLKGCNLDGIDWVIYGGESGRQYRNDDVQWARWMRDRCAEEGIAFFYKQGAGMYPGTNSRLDGVVLQQFPDVRQSLRVFL